MPSLVEASTPLEVRNQRFLPRLARGPLTRSTKAAPTLVVAAFVCGFSNKRPNQIAGSTSLPSMGSPLFPIRYYTVLPPSSAFDCPFLFRAALRCASFARSGIPSVAAVSSALNLLSPSVWGKLSKFGIFHLEFIKIPSRPLLFSNYITNLKFSSTPSPLEGCWDALFGQHPPELAQIIYR